MVLSGGGALLKGLDILISQETKMAVVVAQEPLYCVVAGCSKLLNDKILLDKVKVARSQ